MNIKKGDNVVVMAGQYRRKAGKVLKVFPARLNSRSGGPSAGRLVVEGVNLRKRRERSRRAGKPGQVIEAPAPIAAAKVMVKCAQCRRGRRIGYRFESGRKLRVCRKCGQEFK